ncbi:MAG: SAM-dependent methyltransferase, partial [Bacteroidales bacterium]|nr:SAM-dependent methyltransferase [Bacteroidales bacterium]
MKSTMEDGSIREFDFALINEFFTEMERQGPGSTEETLRALSFIGNLSNKTRIADLGCGTGYQT